MIDLDAAATRRVVAGGAVILLHILVLAALSATGNLQPVLRAVLPARLILPAPPPKPPPTPFPRPTLSAPPLALLPAPDIVVAETAAAAPRQPRASQAVTRSLATVTTGHFGAAAESGLGLDVATAAGGGAGARGTLAAFEAAVRRQVLAGKRQPVQAWDRRRTCVVAYTVRVSPAGGLAGFTIEPCGVPELNDAARAAIQGAAPFLRPPALGAESTEVHGSLIFHP